MSDSRSKQILPKLEDEDETTTSAGQNKKSPHNGGGNQKNRIPVHQGSWCWLLAQDGSPATTAYPYSGNGSKGKDTVSPIDIKGPPEVVNNGTTNSDARNTDAATCENKKPRDLANGSKEGSRWSWLLAQDGTPATVDTKTTTIHANTDTDTTTNTNATAAVSPAAETSAGELTRKALVYGSWHWLLAPDGSPAMAGTHTEEDVVESGTPNSPPATKTTREEGKSRRDPVAQGSWHWLLAPDGSPSIAEHEDSTASRAATGGKRKRGAAPEGRRNASRPTPRSYRCRTDRIGAEPMETDDEHSSCDTADEDGFNPITKRHHAQWEEKFQLLVEYKNKHKTTRVPYRDPALGSWVNHQRRSDRSGRLTKYRRQCLESLGVEFDPLMAEWTEMYNRLLQYKKQHHGSLKVPASRKHSNKHRELSCWIKTQKIRFNANKLSDERKKLLESIGFDWRLSKKCQHLDRNAWMEMYQRLRAYKEKHKSTRVPLHFKADPKLACWVNSQRSRCCKKERVDLLNDIGFEWKIGQHNKKSGKFAKAIK